MRAVRPGELHMGLLALGVQLRPVRAAGPDDHRGGRGVGDRGDGAQPVRGDRTGRRRWLPYLRLLAAIALAGLAILALQLGAVGENPNDGIAVLARNVIGFTGLGLPCSLITGGLLAWTLPIGYMTFCQYALLKAWTAPWTWPVRPPADRGAWICACAVFAAGLLLFTIRGPHTRLSDDS